MGPLIIQYFQFYPVFRHQTSHAPVAILCRFVTLTTSKLIVSALANNHPSENINARNGGPTRWGLFSKPNHMYRRREMVHPVPTRAF